MDAIIEHHRLSGLSDMFWSLIEFITILLLFYFYVFFGHDACGILTPRAGIKPILPALEEEVLTTGPPGRSPLSDIYSAQF